MSEILNRLVADLAPDKRAKLAELLSPAAEPVAIVGIGCRFPGSAPGPDRFWELLRTGTDAVKEVPKRRWDIDSLFDPDPEAAGKLTTRWGGFLDDIESFDAGFFDMTPREAEKVDPQQRLLLEVAWEALENAGLTSDGISGSPMGVFIGACSTEYTMLAYGHPAEVDIHTGMGAANSVLAGRLSYAFNLLGPSILLDTACSSSLVAVHLACQSLRAGECDQAMAGGVNVLHTPLSTLATSRMRMMAADGRCKTFDASADGFVRGEGVGVVVLKLLRDAVRDRDRIWAVIRGSAVNQDGRSAGLTAPNLASQAAVIRRALKQAKVNPQDVTMVEAHGTGTVLGDPIEVEALREVYGRTAGQKCALGSVKTNLGHLEAAAGVAGLIKTTLALHHAQIPPHLHLSKLNPNISFDGSSFYVPAHLTEWKPAQSPRRAAVSSFGFSGTNAHVILEQAPARGEVVAPQQSGTVILPISARSEGALQQLAGAYRDFIDPSRAGNTAALRDVVHTASVRRTHHDYRLAVIGKSREDLTANLNTFLAGEASQDVISQEPLPAKERKIVFVFPGQGSQWLGMGRQLMAESVFRRSIERTAAALRPYVEWSLIDVLSQDGRASRLEQIEVIQPTLFAVEIALADLWKSWGIVPDAVVGHSMGEVAAAFVAGSLTIDDAVKVIVARSALLSRCSGRGAMAMVELSSAATLDALCGYEALVSIAASNGPQSTVISGDTAALSDILREFEAKGVQTRVVKADVAAHSPQMDSIRGELVARLKGLQAATATVPIYSTVDQRRLDGRDLDAAYWGRNLRMPVMFEPTVAKLARAGYNVYVELSPHPLLTLPIEQVLEGHGVKGLVIGSCARGSDEISVIRRNLGNLYCAGCHIDWRAVAPQGTVVDLPRYAWQRQVFPLPPLPFWNGTATASAARIPAVSEMSPERTATSGNVRNERIEEALAVAASPAEARVILEAWLCRQFARVLKLSAGKMNPARSLGRMDSLLSLQMKASVERHLPVKIPISLLLQGASVEQVANEIEKQLPEHGVGTAAATQPEPAAAIKPAEMTFPLTDLQQAYWVGRTGAFELGNASTFFLIVVDLENLDMPRLNRAWQRLVERHEMLRAVVSSDGQQHVLPKVPAYQITVRDLRSHTGQNRDKTLADLQENMFSRVLPSDTWPLFDIRASLIDDNTTRLHIGLEALIVDGWSTALLFREWAQIYHEEQADLPQLHGRFRDHVLGMQALEATPDYERSKSYWTNRLETLPPAAELPLAKSPASVAQTRFTHRTQRVQPALWSSFKQCAEHVGLTPSMALCAAYAEVVSTWSGSRHFTLNLLVSNRGAAGGDMSAVIGNFSATMLLEIDNRPADPFAKRAGKLQQQMWNDLEHAHFSGVRVLRELNRKQASASRASMPLVFASTVHQGAHDEDAATGFIGHLLSMTGSGREVMSKIRTPQVWLDHQAYEEHGGLVLNWDSVDELFPQGMIDDMFRAYTGLVERLAKEEIAWTEVTPVTVPVEHHALYADANRTDAPVPEMLLHHLFERQVAVRGREKAIISPRRTLTFEQADTEARQIARWLRQAGAVPNTLVALIMEKGWEQVVGALGVLKSGAAYVPIDAGLPNDRMAQLLRDARVTLVLTQPWHVHKVRNLEGIRSLLVSPEDLAHLPAEPMPAAQKQNDLAYVIYTSGSTGIPKGVMIEHRGAVNTICDLNARHNVGPTDRVLALSAMSFDLSVYDIFGVLGAGGAIVIPNSQAQREPAHWTELMETAQVTMWNSVPALMEMWIDYVEGRRYAVSSAATLRLIYLSGDWIPVSLPGRIRALLPDARLVGMGGATEASIWSILHEIDEQDALLASVPYGRAMVNQQMHVLNDALEPCPLWVPGNIFIGGIGLARGYWNDRRKTNASFITHPRTGERLYRTGDRGRYLPTGEIEFLGREDFQVKVQGYRIELGEIEAALTRHPGVKTAVVMASGARHASKMLTAYVVLERETPPSVADIRKHLQAQLPEYMVPKAIVTMPSLPLTPVGKVDRKRLPDASPGAPAERLAPEAPRTDVEKQLVEIWENVLSVSSISVHDDFFEIGGHSLLAVRIMTRIREAFGRELPLATLAESRTVEKLAEALGSEQATGRSPLVVLQPKGESAPVFLVHPVGGDVLCYSELARHLGIRQPVYGLQVTEGVKGSTEKTIPEMAARYMATIQTRQPHGPYYLGGWSLGGIVAFEIAQQLKARGESVALLALLDVTPLNGDRFMEADDHTLVQWFVSDLAGLRGRDACPLDLVQGASADEQLGMGLENARKAGIVSNDVGVEQLSHYFEVFRSNLHAMFRYRPQPYSGSVVLFRATSGELGDGRSAADPTGGWAGLAMLGCHTYDVPGNHYSVVQDPSVRTVAQRLKAHLNGTAVHHVSLGRGGREQHSLEHPASPRAGLLVETRP